MEKFTVKAILPASPKEIFSAWLDGKKHEAMTGGKATAKAKANTKHTAWDGYISGKTLEVDPYKKIVQSWRTVEFPDDAEDSLLELKLSAKGKSTVLSITHTNIPKGQGKNYQKGWKEHYFNPMKEYFGRKK